MEAHVGGAADGEPGNRQAGKVVHAEARPVPVEQAENLVTQPGWVAELEHMGEIIGQGVEECGEPFWVAAPARWELVEDGSEARPEPAHPVEELAQRFVWLRELFQVGDVAVGFDGEDKAGRRRRRPVLDRCEAWEVVEAVVEFDGIEDARVVRKPPRLREIRRVERPAPVRVTPARAADADGGGSSRARPGQPGCDGARATIRPNTTRTWTSHPIRQTTTARHVLL